METSPKNSVMDLRQRRPEELLASAERIIEAGDPLPIDMIAKLQAHGVVPRGHW